MLIEQLITYSPRKSCISRFEHQRKIGQDFECPPIKLSIELIRENRVAEANEQGAEIRDVALCRYYDNSLVLVSFHDADVIDPVEDRSVGNAYPHTKSAGACCPTALPPRAFPAKAYENGSATLRISSAHALRHASQPLHCRLRDHG